ncbi:MAG: hypothetical protein LLG01_02410 [Planctomycetaceae bacterium]|nr:hypothetical protein [Planctomycetaceae bacterium]
MAKSALFFLSMAIGLSAASAQETQPATATAAATGPAATSQAASASQPQWTEQSKRQAYLAARSGAFMDMAAQARLLSVTPKVSVKDFLAESSGLEVALMIRLPAISKILDEQYRRGACSLTVVADVPAVAEALAEICTSTYKGNTVKAEDFKKLAADTKGQILLASGESGVVDEHWSSLVEPAVGEGEPRIDNAPPAVREFWQEHCNAWGLRKAEQDAYMAARRHLALQVRGIYIAPEVTVADFVATSDEPAVDMTKFLRGARETGRRYRRDALVVESAVQVRLRSVYMSLRSWARTSHPKASREQVDRLEELILKGDEAVISGTGVAAAPLKHVRNATPEMLKRLALASAAPDWLGRSERASGSAAAPKAGESDEAMRSAMLAAAREARCSLATKFLDLPVGPATTMRDLMAASEPIRAFVATYPLDARVVEGTQKIGDDGRASVTVEAPLGPLWEDVLRYSEACK